MVQANRLQPSKQPPLLFIEQAIAVAVLSGPGDFQNEKRKTY